MTASFAGTSSGSARYSLPFGVNTPGEFVWPCKPSDRRCGQLSGITTMATGQRLSPAFSGTDPANTNQFVERMRPDRVGDGNFDSGEMRDRIKAGLPIFDSCVLPGLSMGRGSYGNSARNILTGPGRRFGISF